MSQAEASGQVAVHELAAIQGQTFDTPQILISNNMGGMEDIPVRTFLLLFFSAIGIQGCVYSVVFVPGVP